MYEPRNLPILHDAPLSLSGVRFGIRHSDEYMSVDDPKMDPLHIHEYTEICFCVSGDRSFMVNNRLYPVASCEAVVTRPNDVHMCIYNNSGKQDHYCLWVDAEPTSPILAFLSRDGFSPLFSFANAEGARLHSLFHRLLELEKTGDAIERTVCFLEIISIFNAHSAEQSANGSIPPHMQQILDDIDANFAEIGHINELLERHFVSSATLGRWFRDHLQISPRKFLEAKKLSCASKLLIGGASVSDACFLSGFSDCSHFIELFKKRFGITPYKYKKSFEK